MNTTTQQLEKTVTTGQCMRIADEYFVQGKLSTASRHYYEALKLSPKNERAYNMIITCDWQVKSRTKLVPYVGPKSWKDRIKERIRMYLDGFKINQQCTMFPIEHLYSEYTTLAHHGTYIRKLSNDRYVVKCNDCMNIAVTMSYEGVVDKLYEGLCEAGISINVYSRHLNTRDIEKIIEKQVYQQGERLRKPIYV